MVLVKDGFKRGNAIKVQLSHVAAMIFSQVIHQGNADYISGVDRIYMAPELNSFKMSPKSDVWSIGIIIYLLVTGGVTDKRHEEFFDFKEAIWFNISEELKEFILSAVTVDPKMRGSIDDLLEMEFI